METEKIVRRSPVLLLADFIPPCFSLKMGTVVSPPVISTNQTTATVPMLQYDCEVNISCLGGYRVSTYTKTITNGVLFVAQ